MHFTEKEIVDNHASLTERSGYYRTFGYDVNQSVAFVLSKAQPLAGRVLEVGTGKGRFLAELSKSVPNVTTIDLDPAEQRFARLNVAYEASAGQVEFVVGDGAKLPWEAGSFDAVVSMNALHHIRDLPGVVNEALRVVRPEGKIVLADFNEEGFGIMEKLHIAEGRVHEHVNYNFHDIVGWFAAVGWNAVLCAGDCQDVLVAFKSRREKMKKNKRGIILEIKKGQAI